MLRRGKESNMTGIPGDPVMLLSFMNMKLRDSYSSKEAMMEDLDISTDEWKDIEDRLAGIDYRYDPAQNRFV
jgi:hypothetical protein